MDGSGVKFDNGGEGVEADVPCTRNLTTLEPWSLDGMSRLRCTIEITLPAKDLGSSTELITLKPWSTGKQLPLGFSVFDQASMKQP